MNYLLMLKSNIPYYPYAGMSGLDRVEHFLVHVVRSGNYFHPNEFRPHAAMFGLNENSISGTFNALLKKGVVINIGPSAYSRINGKRPAKLWKVV